MKIFLCIILGLSARHGAAAEPIDFMQALQRALEKSPQYQTLVLTEANSRLGEKNAWNSLLPSVEATASHAYTRLSGNTTENLETTNYPWSNQFGLSLNENLYDNGDTWRSAEIAGLTNRVDALNLVAGRSQLLVSVAKAYYDFSAAFGKVELQKRQIDALQIQFRAIEGRYRQGLTSNRDYLRIKAQQQSAQIGLLSQQITLDSARSALRLLIGENSEVEFVALDMAKKDFSKIDFPKIAAEQTYEFQIAGIQNQISAVKYESIHRTEWPRLSLSGSSNYVIPEYIGGHIPGVDDPYWNFQAMVVLSYHLWDWQRTTRTVEVAENQRNIEGNTQQLTRLQVLQNLHNYEQQADLLQRSFKMSGEILRSNEEAYRSLNRGYTDGKVTYLELITSLNDFYSSLTQDLTLRFNILKLRADVAYAQGKVDEVLKTF